MSNLGNKEVLAKNLGFYMDRKGVTQKELAEVVGVGTSTVNDWIKAKKYPRIDAIEKMANYFRILKSDLIEEKSEDYRQAEQKIDAIADVTIRMKNDNDFLELVKSLNGLNAEQLQGVKAMLAAFIK